MPSFTEVQERLQSASLQEVLVLAGGGVNGLGFNAVAALRERFLDLAFDDEDLSIQERSLAAAWARSLDGLIQLVLAEQPETLRGYNTARQSSQDQRIRFGYGSAGYLAKGGRAQLTTSELRDIHAQLLLIAFAPSVGSAAGAA